MVKGPGRRLVCLLAALVLLCGGCRNAPAPEPEPPQPAQSLSDQNLTAAVVCLPDGGTDWPVLLDALEQSTLANLNASVLEAGAPLDGFDLLVPDPALIDSPEWEAYRAQLTAYAENGGMLVLDNRFAPAFPEEFLGIAGTQPLNGPPLAMTFPDAPENLADFQQLLRDFAALYPGYYNAEELSARDYGSGFLPDGCTVLAEQDGLAVYTLHQAGAGQVVLTNPLLPNLFSVTADTLEPAEGQAPFAGTSAGANRLFFGKLLAYLSMERFGYAVERVYGPYGSNALSWELHYEDITAVANGSCYQFAELAEQAGQIPSFSLVRNFYWWFLRAESVTYLSNQGTGGELRYEIDEVEDAYSSGTHVLSGDGWLNQAWVEHTISYFSDTGGYDQRAYPCLRDLNGDGRLDLLCGSSDGQFYFYAAEDFTDRYTVSPAVLLTGPDGAPLAVPGGYSAPALADADGDGIDDLISGSADGMLYWFRGLGGLDFDAPQLLLDPGLGTVQTFPDAADLDGDGLDDLLVGSAGGGLVLYGGTEEGFYHRQTVDLPEELAEWVAPCAVDLDGDGALDIALGTFHGYVARLVRDDGGWRHDGYLDAAEYNYKGNQHLKFGNNCKPAFGDVDGDGNPDLICGQLEYGLAYPIDSPYFPFRAQLQEQIDWMEENRYYISTHSLTHWYASDGYEKREFARMCAALESYGVDLSRTGTNEHTWHTSGTGPQTFSNQFREGLLWNSGAELPGSGATPQIAAENVMFLPFFLEEGGEPTMLMLNASTLFYRGEDWASISARYGMPMLMYYHCDMIYKNDAEAREAIQTVADFLANHDYLCVREDQLAYAAAASLNTAVTAAGGEDGSISLSAAPVRTDLALYDPDYQSAVGVKLTFADGVDAGAYTTDASVWRRSGNSLYLSLDHDVTVWKGTTDSAHLRRVNLPAGLRREDGMLIVDFAQDGLMQVEVSGTVSTPSEGWTMERIGDNTRFTRTGAAASLALHLWES